MRLEVERRWSRTSRGGSGDVAALAARLRARQREIEQAIAVRAFGISPARSPSDPGYRDGLRAAVSTAVDYALDVLARNSVTPPPVPAALLVQARMAARHRVSPDVVLRRYTAGYVIVNDFLLEEAECIGMNAADLRRLHRLHAGALDRLLAAIGAEYSREGDDRTPTADRRRAEYVRRLLSGEILDAEELGYDLGGHHLAAIAVGEEAVDALRGFARANDRRILVVHQEEKTSWVWLGGGSPFQLATLGRLAELGWTAPSTVAFGEPGEGRMGWRLSHRQAEAAMAVAQNVGRPCVRYGEVALLASASQDNLLSASLRALFLAPLAQGRDGGAALRETLRVYCSTECNVTATAAALGVTRQTVTNRLRAAEERLHRPLGECISEIDTALRLDELDGLQNTLGDALPD